VTRVPGETKPRFVPLCVPHLGGREGEYLADCVDTAWVSSVGAYVNRFEEAMAQRLGAGHAVAVTSGTAALHLALLAAGVEPNDEVLVPALTFIAPAFAVRHAGAWPVVMDVEPDYWQMDPAKTADFLARECVVKGGVTVNRATGRRVSAMVPVDLLGHPADMDALMDIAGRHGLMVIEDATESLGALYRDRPVGTLAHLACLSFNGNKLITTGGGGMVMTDREQWAERVRYLSTQAKDDAVEYVHGAVGYNYRLTNIQAAMGCAQLERMDGHLAAKQAIAARYSDRLGDVPGLAAMPAAEWARPVHWLYTIMVDEAGFGMDSRALMHRLERENIQTRPLWQPLDQSPALDPEFQKVTVLR